MEPEQQAEWNAWLATRPETVQKLAAEFPPNTCFTFENRMAYVIGYTEDDKLIFSFVDPCKDYNRASKERHYICASHFRD
jgi:hypothetical protein